MTASLQPHFRPEGPTRRTAPTLHVLQTSGENHACFHCHSSCMIVKTSDHCVFANSQACDSRPVLFHFAHQHLTNLEAQSLAVNTAQIVMWIVAIFTHSVESLASADVNVTRHVASRAVSVRVSSEGDRSQKNSVIPTAHCREFDVLLMGLVLCPCSSLCTRLSQARDGFQNTSCPVQRDFTLLFIESNCLALLCVSCFRTERHFVIRGHGWAREYLHACSTMSAVLRAHPRLCPLSRVIPNFWKVTAFLVHPDTLSKCPL